MPPMPTPAEQLCLSCGMCCSGVLHNFTFLQPEELPQARKLGLDVVQPAHRHARPDPRPVFRQPCAVLDGTRCQIYPQRPRACRAYNCHVLERLQSGELDIETALDTVARARRLIDELRARMSEPFDFLPLDWQVRVNWPPSHPLPAAVQPVFAELVGLLRREWKIKWRRTRRTRRD